MEDFPLKTLEIVCLGSSIALSGLFYYIYRKKRKTVDKLSVSSQSIYLSIFFSDQCKHVLLIYNKLMTCVLQEAPQLALDDELANLLNQAPGKCLQYVVIEGNHLK